MGIWCSWTNKGSGIWATTTSQNCTHVSHYVRQTKDRIHLRLIATDHLLYDGLQVVPVSQEEVLSVRTQRGSQQGYGYRRLTLPLSNTRHLHRTHWRQGLFTGSVRTYKEKTMAIKQQFNRISNKQQ